MNKKIIVALDDDNPQKALDLARLLDPNLCRVKIGKNLFTRAGHSLIEQLHTLGHQIFLDLKFHDIPNTVAAAVRAAAELNIWMVNVHASGGLRMMNAAAEALQNFSNPPLLIAVTVLTSMGPSELEVLGVTRSLEEQVLALAKLSKEANLLGVVCSAQETRAVKELCGNSILTITPAIRPLWAASNDQVRVVTPSEALKNGSDFLVIGRPITAATEPLSALARIHQEITNE